MKKLITAAIAILLTSLFMSPVLAKTTKVDKKVDKKTALQAVASGESNVPQAQVEYQKKREEDKEKRKQMLKVRNQNVQRSGGSTIEEINGPLMRSKKAN